MTSQEQTKEQKLQEMGIPFDANKLDHGGRWLCRATGQGNKKAVELLLDLMPPEAKDQKDDEHYTALMRAAEEDQAPIAELLLQRGAAVDTASAISAAGNKKTALDIAFNKGHTKVVQAILEHYTEERQDDELSRSIGQALLSAVASDNINAVRLLFGDNTDGSSAALRLACSNNLQGVAKLILQNGAAVSSGDKTLAQQAVTMGDFKFALRLKRGGLSFSEAYDKDGTVLKKAVESGSMQLTLDLLKHRDVDVNSTKLLLLHHAAQHGKKAVVHSLMKAGADPNKLNPKGETAINLAISCEKTEFVEALIKETKSKCLINGEDVVVNKKKESALHVAATTNAEAIIDILLKKKNFFEKALKHKDRDDRTPLMIAAKRGRVSVVQKFLDCPKPPLYEQWSNKHNLTPLFLAAQEGHKDVVQLLCEYSWRMKEIPNDKGMTPLMKACEVGRQSVVQFLLSDGADINKRDSVKRTALHHAVEKGDREVVLEILRKDPLIDWKHWRGASEQSPITIAASRRNDKILQILMQSALPKLPGETPEDQSKIRGELWSAAKDLMGERGGFELIKLNAQQNDSTPLIEAIKQDSFDIVNYLLDKGMPPDTRASKGGTALSEAKGKKEITDILHTYGAKDGGKKAHH